MASKEFVDRTGLSQFAKEVKSYVKDELSKLEISEGEMPITEIRLNGTPVTINGKVAEITNVVETEDIFDDNNKVLSTKLPDFIFGQLMFGGLIMEALDKSNGTLSPSSAFANRFNTTQSVQTITPSQAATYSNTYFIVQDFSVESSTYTNAQILGITGLTTGDWIVSDGSSWQRVDNTDAVKTVNGKAGIVSLLLSDLGYTASGYTAGMTGSSTELLTTDGALSILASANAYVGTYIGQQRQDGPIDANTSTNKLVSVGALKNYAYSKTEIDNKGYQTADGVKSVVASNFTVNGDSATNGDFAIDALTEAEVKSIFAAATIS